MNRTLKDDRCWYGLPSPDNLKPQTKSLLPILSYRTVKSLELLLLESGHPFNTMNFYEFVELHSIYFN